MSADFEDESTIFDQRELARFYQKATELYPETMEYAKSLPAFDYGERPLELIGCTSKKAVWIETDN